MPKDTWHNQAYATIPSPARPARPVNPATGRAYTKKQAAAKATSRVYLHRVWRGDTDRQWRVVSHYPDGSYVERYFPSYHKALHWRSRTRLLHAVALYTGDDEWAAAQADEYDYQVFNLGNVYRWQDEVFPPRAGWYDFVDPWQDND